MVPCKSFTFAISRIHFLTWKFKVKINFTASSLHQIKGVKFIFDSHEQTSLSTLYICSSASIEIGRQIDSNADFMKPRSRYTHRRMFQCVWGPLRGCASNSACHIENFYICAYISMELDEKECSFSSQRVFFDESKREGKKILKFALNSRRALSED